MGLWDRLKGKAQEKKDELERKAMERAAEMALKKTKDTAKSALDSVGKTIENAIFGPESEKKDDGEHEPRDEASPASSEDERRRAREKVKAKADARKAEDRGRAAAKGESGSSEPPAKKEPLTRDYDRFVKDKEQKERELEKAVDDDLAALKKRLGKK